MKKLAILIVAAAPLAFAADQEDPNRVVPAGSPDKGKEVFIAKRCYRCHTVEEEKLPESDLPAIHHIHLGGTAFAGWTRDRFAAEIMNPEHFISPQHQAAMIRVGDRLGAENSPMPHFNDALTVADLIALASYLEERSK